MNSNDFLFYDQQIADEENNRLNSIQAVAYENIRQCYYHFILMWAEQGDAPESMERAKEIIFDASMETSFPDGDDPAPMQMKFVGRDFVEHTIDTLFECDKEVENEMLEVANKMQW